MVRAMQDAKVDKINDYAIPLTLVAINRRTILT